IAATQAKSACADWDLTGAGRFCSCCREFLRRFQFRIGIAESITITAVPNGLLQQRYNPTFQDTIWIAGRNAPSRGELFRVRLSFSRLKAKSPWRVQKIPLPPDGFVWDN
ncbi:MAG TPA: hypothetical protein ENK32_03915, partial [Anaerolineae bacterium]|nr:hypothetical protein [Anaerolineae bacterium]